MSDELFKQVWQTQTNTLPQRAPENLRAEATAFQRKIERRNRREYLAGAFVIPVFCFYIWLFPYWVTRVGAAMVVLGTMVVMWQLHQRASSRVVPSDFGGACLQFQCAELARQRDALRSVWLWYLGPLLPGLVVFMWGQQGGSANHPVELIVDVFMLVVFLAIAWLNRRAAVKLQRQIDTLEAMVDPEVQA